MQFIVKDVLISLDSSQLCFFEKSSAFLYRFQFIRRPIGACKSQPIVPPSGAEFVDYIFGLLTFFANPEPKTCLVSGFYRTSFIRRSAKKDYVIRLKFTTFRYSIYFFDSVEQNFMEKRTSFQMGRSHISSEKTSSRGKVIVHKNDYVIKSRIDEGMRRIGFQILLLLYPIIFELH